MKGKYGPFFGFAVLVMAAIFTLAACGDSDSGDPTSPSGDDPAKVATPTVSPAAGVVDAGTEITLSTSTGGAVIRYTIDGTNPTPAAGTVYSASSKPAITADTTIKAVAYKDGMTDSDVLTAAYTIPIAISSLDQLNAISANAESLSKSYKLMADIAGLTTPIGMVSGGALIPFMGGFDGNGHTVTVNITTGLSDPSTGTFTGLFAGIGGRVHDLKVAGTINITVTGGGAVFAGGVAGIALQTASVSNAASSVDVSAGGSGSDGSVYAGGVLGLSQQGTVSNVYATGDISATAGGGAYAGGVLGVSSGAVSNVYATGGVSAETSGAKSAYAGGIAGTVSSSGGSVSYAYATGSISAKGTGAGIAADEEGQTTIGAGGIAGAATNAPVRYTVALNSGVSADDSTSTSPYNNCSYRITSTSGGEVITNGATNYGKADLVPSGGDYGQHEGSDKEDGEDVSVTGGPLPTPYTAPDQPWWTGTGFSGANWTTVWQWDSAKGLPVLR
ncbi:MAG: chitobiase/beta-hexosaminidase C-terminal domain-containing protein [Treponema sp.]|jgi:hypothetical protein|nr:chitobiase/beta-hexosaminidase C-terminal domain-containing protein [Treponema sp.]